MSRPKVTYPASFERMRGGRVLLPPMESLPSAYGPWTAYQASESVAAMAVGADGSNHIILLIGQPLDQLGVGLFTTMSAAEARGFAAGLMRLADKFDGGAARQ